MSKDPAFLFYSQDFFMGVQLMSWEDRGKYITLLCVMHQHGRMSEERVGLLVGSVSVSLREKFQVDEAGNWFSEKLEFVIAKRQDFIDKQIANGKKGGRPKNPNKTQTITQKQSQTKPIIEDEIENKDLSKSNATENLHKVGSTAQKLLEVVMPWDSPEFMEAWDLWKQHRKQSDRHTYKPIGEQAALSELANLSGGNEDTAIQIIKQSMSNSWKGFFALKNEPKNGNIRNSSGNTIEGAKAALARVCSQ